MSSIKIRVIGLLALLALPLALGCCTIAGATAGAVVGGGAGLVCDAVILAPFAIVSSVLGCNKSHEAMSAKEIEQLCKAGVDDQVIITQIEQVGMRAPLSVKEMVRLKKKGVSSEVIQIAQQYPSPISKISSDLAGESQASDSSPQLASSKTDEMPEAELSEKKLPSTESHLLDPVLTAEIDPSFRPSPDVHPYTQSPPISEFFE